jgi:hypothetical protein
VEERTKPGEKEKNSCRGKDKCRHMMRSMSSLVIRIILQVFGFFNTASWPSLDKLAN